jgi:hypothetical protein
MISVAVLILLPFSWTYVRKLRPKMTWMLFLELFVLSLVG